MICIQKEIVAPCGTTLGNWGVVDNISSQTAGGATTLTAALVTLYASKAAHDAGNPAYAVHQYFLNGVTVPSGGDPYALAAAQILLTEDSGDWTPINSRPRGPQGQQPWKPGWKNGQVAT